MVGRPAAVAHLRRVRSGFLCFQKSCTSGTTYDSTTTYLDRPTKKQIMFSIAFQKFIIIVVFADTSLFLAHVVLLAGTRGVALECAARSAPFPRSLYLSCRCRPCRRCRLQVHVQQMKVCFLSKIRISPTHPSPTTKRTTWTGWRPLNSTVHCTSALLRSCT